MNWDRVRGETLTRRTKPERELSKTNPSSFRELEKEAKEFARKNRSRSKFLDSIAHQERYLTEGQIKAVLDIKRKWDR